MDLNEVMNRAGTAVGRSETAGAGRAGLSFGDFIDVINPLQHIPGIAELYRKVTNDRISDDARTAGNMLYGLALGGPVGLGAMMAYTVAGDRMKPVPNAQDMAAGQLGQAAPVNETPVEQEPAQAPVPQRKPEITPAVPPGRQEALLGEAVAATGRLPGQAAAPLPADAATLLTTSSPSGETDASSVSYLDASGMTGEKAEMVPDQDGLSLLATHKSNHLPLDVLRALQERHAQRTASERS
ncbi:MAG: hypothetical protein Tsb0019_01230 [Roseibium sp.]